MKTLVLGLILFSTIGAGVLISANSWGTPECLPVGKIDKYEWITHKNKDNRCLMRNGIQVGVWVISEKKYYPLDRERDIWLPATKPPITPPVSACECCAECVCPTDPCVCKDTARPCKQACRCATTEEVGIIEQDGIINFGIDRNSIERESLNKYQRKIESVPKDQFKLRLTIIGPAPRRKLVIDDLYSHPEMRKLLDNFIIQDYAPDNWAVRPGFYTNGDPTIYIQNADGKVLHRQDSYASLDSLSGALRKVNDSYDAKRDPNLNKNFSLADFFKDINPEYLKYGAIGVLSLVLFYLWRNNNV